MSAVLSLFHEKLFQHKWDVESSCLDEGWGLLALYCREMGSYQVLWASCSQWGCTVWDLPSSHGQDALLPWRLWHLSSLFFPSPSLLNSCKPICWYQGW